MPYLPESAPKRQNNNISIIIGPRGAGAKAVALDRIHDAAFLTLQTSPGNHQAWVAVSGLTSGEETKEFARRLRKGVGADPSASGATRVAGTTNYKRKYEYEPDFPTVTILDAVPETYRDSGPTRFPWPSRTTRARPRRAPIQGFAQTHPVRRRTHLARLSALH